MRTFKRWLVRLGEWLISIGRDQTDSAEDDRPADDPLFNLALVHTQRQDDNWPDRDGEAKRAAVYAQMVNSYPKRSKREISRMIEEALPCGE